MTAQFEIGGNDVEGYDAIVGQAAWLGLRLRHWPLLFLVHAERLALNQSKTYADLEHRPCRVEENEMSYHIEINEANRVTLRQGADVLLPDQVLVQGNLI